MRIEAFVQARMNSTRLPGKVMKEVLGKSLLEFLVERLQQAKEIDDIVILTTTHRMDDCIENFCQKKGVSCFRGSEEDVLDRYYQAAKKRSSDAIVRITADCPLLDPEIVDEAIRVFRQSQPNIDYLSNSLERTYPRGLDVEVFSFQALKTAFYAAKKQEEREHVTVYLYHHPELFLLKNIVHFPSLGHYRWTVDTIEDFELIRSILENLYPSFPKFRLKDVLELFAKYPAWFWINAHIEQKKISFDSM